VPLLAALFPIAASAQGTLPLALTQQFSFTNCATFTNACGTPLIGGLLYFYQVGTVATQQDSFQDTALTIKNPWPLPLDANGRVPTFYLANGSIHVRLTDANGVVQFDVPNQLVIGPSSGGGGGSSVDPTSVASTGDFKWRATGEFITGWVKANAQTIGSATSGATQRANADTQNLFIYEWTICPNAHCPVLGGRGANALADFNANKQLTLPDCRGRVCGVGLDDMGNTAAGRLFAQNVSSGGGDGVTTPNASGGEALHTMSVTELVAHAHSNSLTDPGHIHSNSLTDPGHIHTGSGNVSDPGHGHNFSLSNVLGGGAGNIPVGSNAGVNTSNGTAVNAAVTGVTVPSLNINNHTTGVTINNAGASTGVTINNASQGSTTPFNVMQPFMLGTWYIKL
jgi:hypothetical protein